MDTPVHNSEWAGTAAINITQLGSQWGNQVHRKLFDYLYCTFKDFSFPKMQHFGSVPVPHSRDSTPLPFSASPRLEIYNFFLRIKKISHKTGKCLDSLSTIAFLNKELLLWNNQSRRPSWSCAETGVRLQQHWHLSIRLWLQAPATKPGHSTLIHWTLNTRRIKALLEKQRSANYRKDLCG